MTKYYVTKYDRLFVTLTNLYYSLIYPFLIYGVFVWGNAYLTTINRLYILQKKTMRIITFSSFDNTQLHFRSLNIINLSDRVIFYTAVFMFKLHNNFLPSYFDTFLTSIADIDTHYPARQECFIEKYTTRKIHQSRTQSPLAFWSAVGRQ